MDELKFNNGLYLFESKPYSGEVVDKYESGTISAIVTLKQGIPNGKWQVLGYQHELIQEGLYTPIEITDKIFSKNIIRLNLIYVKEGQYSFYNLNAIMKNINYKLDCDTVYMKKYVSDYCHCTLKEITFRSGEL